MPSLCADPCTHSVQDLNGLTCLCNFWNCGIWRSFFWWPLNIKFFLWFGAGDSIYGTLIFVLPPTFTPSCPLEVEIGRSPDN